MALSDEAGRGDAFKRVFQQAVRRVGFHIGRYPPVDSLAYHLKTLLRLLEIDYVLDVGAHMGEFAESMRELGYTGEIRSFEPVRSSFEALTKARAADKAWRGENIALGPEDGELEMNICEGSVFNSFLKPVDNDEIRFREQTRVVRVEKVPVRRLEAVLDEILAERPGAKIFLKMDTQGYDLQVLRGAGRRIDTVRALITELAARSTYANMPSLPEALIELGRFGFEVTGMFPVARELDHLRVIEFDCVMCRKPATR
jgi:FkbM family methyltransferase